MGRGGDGGGKPDKTDGGVGVERGGLKEGKKRTDKVRVKDR